MEPDIVCIAKGIASGMPLGVCMTRAEIMDWAPGSHASTFGGNPVSIAAALATMDIIEREGIANAARVGEFMLERVRGWKQSHRSVGDVRGRGLMIGIEIVKDKATREPAVALRNRVETLAFERGLMMLGCGETSLRLSPPLIVSKEEATVALDILEEALTMAEKEHEQSAVASRDGLSVSGGFAVISINNGPRGSENPCGRAVLFRGQANGRTYSAMRMLAISEVRCAARSRLCAISFVARRCSSAAAAI